MGCKLTHSLSHAINANLSFVHMNTMGNNISPLNCIHYLAVTFVKQSFWRHNLQEMFFTNHSTKLLHTDTNLFHNIPITGLRNYLWTLAKCTVRLYKDIIILMVIWQHTKTAQKVVTHVAPSRAKRVHHKYTCILTNYASNPAITYTLMEPNRCPPSQRH